MSLQEIERALQILYAMLDDADHLTIGRSARLRVVAAIGELENARAKARKGSRTALPTAPGGREDDDG